VRRADGSLHSRQYYMAFGEERYTYNTLPTDRTYTGQREIEFGLVHYGARVYDPYLNRFLSPDSIVPSTDEGNNPIAVGYVASANYSALVVDYHENQLLEQMNRENRNRQGDPNARLPGVPTNPLTLDRYAYSLNNPTRYVDPSGHNPIVLALAAIGPVGWVALGVLSVGTVVYFASGGPEAFAEGLTPTIESLSYQVSQSLTTLTAQAAQAANGLQTLFARKKDLGFIDHLCDRYGIKDKAIREKVHREISKKHYTDEEIEEIVQDIADQFVKGSGEGADESK